jgi:hypothetical protein
VELVSSHATTTVEPRDHLCPRRALLTFGFGLVSASCCGWSPGCEAGAVIGSPTIGEGVSDSAPVSVQPLGGHGPIISGTDGRFVMDGPFTETKEAVGGYIVLQADRPNGAVEIARSMPTLRYGIIVYLLSALVAIGPCTRHRQRERGRSQNLRLDCTARERRRRSPPVAQVAQSAGLLRFLSWRLAL